MYDFEAGDVVVVRFQNETTVLVGTFVEYNESLECMKLAITDNIDMPEDSTDWLEDVKRIYMSRPHNWTFIVYDLYNALALHKLGFKEERKPHIATATNTGVDIPAVAVPGYVMLGYGGTLGETLDVWVRVVTKVNENGYITEYAEGTIYSDDFYFCKDFKKLITEGVESWKVYDRIKYFRRPLKLEDMYEELNGWVAYATNLTTLEFDSIRTQFNEETDAYVNLAVTPDRSNFANVPRFMVGANCTESPRTHYNTKLDEGWVTAKVIVTTEHDLAFRSEHQQELKEKGFVSYPDNMDDDDGRGYTFFKCVRDNVMRGYNEEIETKGPSNSSGDEGMSLGSLLSTLTTRTTKTFYECTLTGIARYSDADAIKDALSVQLEGSGITVLDVKIEPWDYRREPLR